jgi:uncharacterized protein YbjQ (UPF0145 family)
MFKELDLFTLLLIVLARLIYLLGGKIKMLITTTPNIEGKKISEYKGLVSGEAILGANLFKDLFASITDVIGGRSGAYERELRKAKDIALEEMITEARNLGANAVIAIDLDYETIGSGGGNMLMVSASGTAVIVE